METDQVLYQILFLGSVVVAMSLLAMWLGFRESDEKAKAADR
jgi:hypothetical protein